jgi:Mg2+-importing ATPase
MEASSPVSTSKIDRAVHRLAPPVAHAPDAYWAAESAQVAQRLGVGVTGLSSAAAAERLRTFGPNQLRAEKPLSRLRVLGEQVRSPLLLLLFFAAVVSAATGEWVDAGIVTAIVVASLGIGYKREYQAAAAAAALSARVKMRAQVLRDSRVQDVPVEEVVPGDVVELGPGSLIPADAVVLEADECLVNEAALTGESFPVPKEAGPCAVGAALGQRSNCLFLGTNVRGGTARALVVATAGATEFGNIAHRLTVRAPETEFDRGIRRFGYLLTSAMLVLVIVVFAAHAIAGRPVVSTLLFSIALAVGLSPELLPVILSINLARSAEAMAKQGVLVRRLNAIENLGSMDVLCTDKTGTLTEGVVQLAGVFDAEGTVPDGPTASRPLELGAINAAFASGLRNPLDEAILARWQSLPAASAQQARWRKIAEIPFDHVRKRASVVVAGPAGRQLVVKGAFAPVLAICDRFEGGARFDAATRAALAQRCEAWGRQGIRVLAVACKSLPEQPTHGPADETGLALVGWLTFLDQPKAGAKAAIAQLARAGVAIKIITGDSRLVAQHLAGLVGLDHPRVLTGAELDDFHTEGLWRRAETTDLFVEVDPRQKERIILALKKLGHVVGFLGDGVNDAPAMHAADASLSVESAVDVARAAADFVLLERDLEVIHRGIVAGRTTFANTMKYLLTTTSANLGNMVSMAATSLFLPFLPLTAGQILLNNLLSDVPAVGLADDAVDPETVAQPHRFSIRLIGRFMLQFGLLSSAFDLLAFAVLFWGFRANEALFRTGWFVESLLTELLVALVLRTWRPFYRSRPGRTLLITTVAVTAFALILPYLPGVGWLGFVPLPPALLAVLLTITLGYVLATEFSKRHFFRGGA